MAHTDNTSKGKTLGKGKHSAQKRRASAPRVLTGPNKNNEEGEDSSIRALKMLFHTRNAKRSSPQKVMTAPGVVARYSDKTSQLTEQLYVKFRTGGLRAHYKKLVGNDPVWAVRQGLPITAVDDLIETGGISTGEFHQLVLPRRTVANRRASGVLTADQSDKLVRVARVIAKTEETFGDAEKAYRWLRRPTAPLNGEEPLKLLDTEAGARLVEDLLIRIDHGIAA